jgi:hypothetical protein
VDDDATGPGVAWARPFRLVAGLFTVVNLLLVEPPTAVDVKLDGAGAVPLAVDGVAVDGIDERDIDGVQP